MKHKRLIGAGTVVLAVAGALTFGSIQTFASSSVEEEAIQTVVKYLNAVEGQNAEEAVKYVEDVRFPDPTSLLSAYKEMTVNNPAKDIKIISTNEKDSKHVNITIEFMNEFGEKETAVLPMTKNNTDWKVIFTEITQKPVKIKK